MLISTIDPAGEWIVKPLADDKTEPDSVKTLRAALVPVSVIEP
jgi:hypothetical protein